MRVLSSPDKETAFGQMGLQGRQRGRGHGPGAPARWGAPCTRPAGRCWIAAASCAARSPWPRRLYRLAGIEPVLAAPGAQHHLGMVQEIAVDGDLHALDGERGGLQPGGVGVGWRLAGGALAQEQDVGDDARCLPALEGLGGQADRAQEIGLLREMLPAGRRSAYRACSGWSPGPARRPASGRPGTWPGRNHAGRGASPW